MGALCFAAYYHHHRRDADTLAGFKPTLMESEPLL
jgi:hypothetical protein